MSDKNKMTPKRKVEGVSASKMFGDAEAEYIEGIPGSKDLGDVDSEYIRHAFGGLLTPNELQELDYIEVPATPRSCLILVDGFFNLVAKCLQEIEAHNALNSRQIHCVVGLEMKMWRMWCNLRDALLANETSSMELEVPSGLNFNEHLARMLLALGAKEKLDAFAFILSQASLTLDYCLAKGSHVLGVRLGSAGNLLRGLCRRPISLFFMRPDDWHILESICLEYEEAWKEKRWECLGISQSIARTTDLIVDTEIAISHAWCKATVPLMLGLTTGNEIDWKQTLPMAYALRDYILDQREGSLRSLGTLTKEDRFMSTLRAIKDADTISKELAREFWLVVRGNQRLLLAARATLMGYFLINGKEMVLPVEAKPSVIQRALQSGSLSHDPYEAELLRQLPDLVSVHLRRFLYREAWLETVSLRPFLIGAGLTLAAAIALGDNKINLRSVLGGIELEVYHLLQEVPAEARASIESPRLRLELFSRISKRLSESA